LGRIKSDKLSEDEETLYKWTKEAFRRRSVGDMRALFELDAVT